MTLEQAIEVASLWGSLSPADQRQICRDNMIFCEYLAKYYKDLELYYANEVADRGMIAVMIVAKPLLDTIVCFTHPNYRKCGYQKYLMSQLKRDYAGKELHVKLLKESSYGWHEFWHRNGFNLSDFSENCVEYVWDGERE